MTGAKPLPKYLRSPPQNTGELAEYKFCELVLVTQALVSPERPTGLLKSKIWVEINWEDGAWREWTIVISIISCETSCICCVLDAGDLVGPKLDASLV